MALRVARPAQRRSGSARARTEVKATVLPSGEKAHALYASAAGGVLQRRVIATASHTAAVLSCGGGRQIAVHHLRSDRSDEGCDFFIGTARKNLEACSCPSPP